MNLGFRVLGSIPGLSTNYEWCNGSTRISRQTDFSGMKFYSNNNAAEIPIPWLRFESALIV